MNKHVEKEYKMLVNKDDASYIFERSPRHPVLGCPFYLHYLCLRYQPSRCGYRNLLVLLRADGGSIGSGPAA